MSGNQGVGVREGGRDVQFDIGAIPLSPVAVAETIYVGRASFRVAHDSDVTPAPMGVTTPWFRPLASTTSYEQTAIVAVGPRWHEAASSSSDGLVIPQRVERSRLFGLRKLGASPWTIGLPLTFGAFFCGLLISPLATSSFSSREKAATPPAAAAAPAVAPVPQQPLPVVAPVVAPITPIEPAHERQLNLVAAGHANRGLVQGRTTKKIGLRNPSAPRRFHTATSLEASSSDLPAVKHAWVDPWADN